MKNQFGGIKNLMYGFLFTAAYNILHPVLFAERRLSMLKAKRFAVEEGSKPHPKISIVVLTFNALEYVKKCLESLQKYRPENCEIIVVDNGSNLETVEYLKGKKQDGLIDKLHLSNENNYFAKGNNIGVSLASGDSEYILLLNSDVEIISPGWLLPLINLAEPRCIVSLGITGKPVLRPDGWCFLVDRKTYGDFGGLNEYYKMNWGITELTGKALQRGIAVKSVINPGRYIVHYGQKSYLKKKAGGEKFNQMPAGEVISLFKGKPVELFKV